MRINEVAQSFFLYHATTPERLPSILQHGLDPSKAPPSGHSAGWEPKPWIYLAIDAGHAAAYEYTPVVLQIDVSRLDPKLLGPDDDDLDDILSQDDESDLEWHQYSWQDSLRICGQCTYRGVIPPSAITVHPVK